MQTRKISPPISELSQLRTPLEPGEHFVLDFFNKYLPIEWEIYIQPHLNGCRPDFVLLNPNIGIAVFEVKDWDLSSMRYFVVPDSDPQKKPKLMIRDGNKTFEAGSNDPVTKIIYYKEMIEELFCPRMQTTAAKALITAGIIFTKADTQKVNSLLEPLLDAYKMQNEKAAKYYPVAGMDALRQGNIEIVFPEALRRSSSIMKTEYAADLRNWLEEPSISREQRVPLEKIVDPRQKEFILNRAPFGFRRIRGPAGSGKSLVLAGRAGRLVAEKKDVLVVSYNITLLHYLQDLAVRYSAESRCARKNATWLNFHLLCKTVSFQAGKFNEYHDLWKSFGQRADSLNESDYDGELEKMLSETLPMFVDSILSSSANSFVSKYDAILVDEGQDFRPEWWNLLRKLLKDGGEMMLVADATQDLYGTARRWTDESMKGLDTGFRGPWNFLEVSYRLPEDFLPYVRRYAEMYLPSELMNLPNPKAPGQGDLLRQCNMRWVQLKKASSTEACADEIIRLLRRYSSGKLSVADVVFISQRINTGERIVELLRQKYGYCFAHTFSSIRSEQQRLKHAFFLGDARMKATTIHSFKWYEARAIVIFVDENSCQPTKELLYVGLTRLREDQDGTYITVVSGHPKLAEYGRSWPEYAEL